MCLFLSKFFINTLVRSPVATKMSLRLGESSVSVRACVCLCVGIFCIFCCALYADMYLHRIWHQHFYTFTVHHMSEYMSIMRTTCFWILFQEWPATGAQVGA